jgi:hypothetical protein
MANVPPAFWRELAVVLAAKALLLTVLYFAFFAAPHLAGDISAHLFAATGLR